MHINKYFFCSLLLLLSCFLQQTVYAQCATPINSFPYSQDFEISDGGWVTGTSSATVASDWEWGSPAKTVITGAASGTKCWIAGGLTKTSYNNGERSWLQSPCFDISSLSNPEISFKAFWETERRYDGASFQFSTDGGATFQTLGSINSNSDCSGENWFNYDPIFFISGPGWSGNIQATSGSCQGGGGSGGWLTSKHSLSVVAGATSIIFRFIFAAGLTCNDYDGFAIDDINIGEAGPNAANYSFTCAANNSVNFASTITGCRSGVTWDFGDIASGANNNSSLENPSHTFSSSGSYLVTLTVNFSSGPALGIARRITVIDVVSTIATPVKCFGDHTGEITVNVNPPGTYTYTWDTSPVELTPTISNLAAGTYTVTVTGTDVCSISLPVQLAEPNKLTVATTVMDATCSQNNGSITTAVNGGTIPYSYAWSNAAITSSVSNLSPASYSLTVTDANGCTANANNIMVVNNANNIAITLGQDKDLCPGQSLILNPGNFASYKWQDNSISSTYTVNSAGTYSVTVTDNSGCSGFASVKVTTDCKEIYFPSAFTPNGDNRNDGFGPLPYDALSSLGNYKLTVYGRWGEVIFTSTDPFKQWDGKYKGKPLPTQVLTWIATFTINNLRPEIQKGTISIIR